MAKYQTLRLILGDQLHAGHSWFDETDPHTLHVIAELRQETDYVFHHVQKICGFFAAMEKFASYLASLGHDVIHLNLDETQKWQDLPAMITDLTSKYQVDQFHYQRPDEYRVLEQLERLSLPASVTIRRFDTEHFLIPFDELGDYFDAGKHQRMEFFYRQVRRRFGFLMEGDKPLGGRWNFDTENRQRLRASDVDNVPAPLVFANDVSEILNRLDRHDIKWFGTPKKQLPWPVDRNQALDMLLYFCQHCLADFGRYQDAMTCASEHRWSLYHSRLSFALNCKLLSPQEVIETAINQFERSSTVDIAQVEGFVRQIVGWREYIRGVYWINMPHYRHKNELNAKRKLPEFFWTAQTKMRCLQEAVEQSLQFAYAHHIQRLMVTGNFCLLTGIDPVQVDAWYLGIYMDALEWAEMPNTRGMSQFADGGLIATKPYAASGNYINRMSDYCRSCHYQVKERSSENACPLNSLYWHFMERHRDLLAGNQRIGMIYRNWDKTDEESRNAVLARGAWLLDNLDCI